jgi:hypothetical protein
MALTNGMGAREAAEHWDLPLPACEEIFAYCEAVLSVQPCLLIES